MNNLNSILIEGELVADPGVAIAPEGATITSFTLRVRRVVKESDGTFTDRTITVPCLTTGRLAEVCSEYLKKGRGVRVVGRIDSLGGPVDAPLLSVAAEHVEFKPTKKSAAIEHTAAVAL